MANLPPVTDRDLVEHPNNLRKMPNGGYAWKCGLCAQVASSLTQSGPRCYQHGGTRKRSRDRLKSSKVKQAGTSVKPPGRPMKHGWYSEGEMFNLFELVEQYRAAGFDPDATDEDMLHLRARLQRLQTLEPESVTLGEQLKALLAELTAWCNQPVVDASPFTVAQVLEKLDEYSKLAATIVEFHSNYTRFIQLGDAIEERHARLIKLAHVRADTRLKNKAAEQLDVFCLLLQRLMVVLSETMAPEDFLALQRRLQKDLEQVPVRALDPNTTASLL